MGPAVGDVTGMDLLGAKHQSPARSTHGLAAITGTAENGPTGELITQAQLGSANASACER